MRRIFTVAMLAATSISTSSISAEKNPTQAQNDAGLAVGTAFLQELVDPARTKYRVGVVVAWTDMLSEGTAFLISPKGEVPIVEYIAGRNVQSIPRLSARNQIANPNTEQFHFTVIRKIINSGNCPALTEAVTDFYSKLETTLAAPVHLTDPPPGPDSVISDAPEYVAQIALAGWARLSISHMGQWDHPLMRTTAQLQEVVRKCSSAVATLTVQDYSFSWGRAVLLKQPP